MTRLAVVALVALLAWALSKRRSTNPSSTKADPMDGVQPPDPVTDLVTTRHHPDGSWSYETHYPLGGSSVSFPEPHGWSQSITTYPAHGGNHEAGLHPDPSYLEATALAAIRRTQSGPVGPSA